MREVITYERLHRNMLAWVKRKILRLALFGPPSVGKSQAYKSVLHDLPHHLFGGHQSPLYVYNTLYEAPDLPVVLDDISELLGDLAFIDLLKNLLETSDERVIRWGTSTSKLEGRPTSFTCTCPVLIVLNKMPARDPDLEAILDRVDAIRFEPTKAEIIARMYELWPDEDELIALLAELPAMPSLRTLDRARRWKRSAHLNLVEELLSECGVPEPVARLAQIMEAFPEQEWSARYLEQTNLTDRSFRRHKRIAEQLLACRKSPHGCPIVRPSPPEAVSDTTVG